jgi:predicted glycosyltransferase involved in capsule biosynthesis
MDTLINSAPIIIPILVSCCAIWLIYNIILQKRIELKLEKLMKAHEQEFIRMLKESYKYHKNEDINEEVINELILKYFKKQVMFLSQYEKTTMNKVVDRKKSADQVRYISKLYEESGLSLFNPFKSKTHAL